MIRDRWSDTSGQKIYLRLLPIAYCVRVLLRNTQYAILSLSFFLILLWLLLPVATLAQEPEYGEINEIAKQLNCPTCAGINLADCRTLTCEQWRGQITDLLAQGYSEQEVLDYFSARYGDQVLQEPPRSGFTLVLWVLPVLALVIGGGWLYYTLRRWSAPQPATASPAVPSVAPTPVDNLTDNYVEQVERDLGLK